MRLTASAVGRPDDWAQWPNRPQTHEQPAALRACITRGAPFGSEVWGKRVVAEWDLYGRA